jgi:succinylglutamic semialdehyde dehydrogenase
MNGNASHWIDNHWVLGDGNEFSSISPSFGNVLWKGKEASNKVVDQAVIAAKRSFFSWSTEPLGSRVHYIQAFQDKLLEKKEEVALAISEETGKPLWESRNEVQTMLNKVDISISAYIKRCDAKEIPLGKGRLYTRYRPHGVLSVLGPFNFPGHLPNGHILPALVAGNTVIFKPSEKTPMVGEVYASLWQESKLPSGVFNMVQGGRETGRLLAENRKIDGLLFTGSYEAGLQLSQIFASTPGRMLALEMGGNNPLIVEKVENIEGALQIVLESAFLTSGQRCSGLRRLIIPDTEWGVNFLQQLIDKTKELRIGPYNIEPEPFMGPLISQEAADRILEKQAKILEKGGKSLLMAKKMTWGPAFITPGIVDVTSSTDIPDEECFGPLLQVIRSPNFKASINEANRTEYGLTAGLVSDDAAHWHYFYQEVRAGILNWNAPLTGASSKAPFGGIGKSGNLRPSAYMAADYCSYPVATLEQDHVSVREKLPYGQKE